VASTSSLPATGTMCRFGSSALLRPVPEAPVALRADDETLPTRDGGKVAGTHEQAR